MRKQQVLRIDRATHHVGKHTERCADQHDRHDHEPVETVGEIDRIARADNHQIRQHDEAPHAERIADRLDERQQQIGARRQAHRQTAAHPRHEQVEHAHVARFRYAERQIHRSKQTDDRLPEILFARRHPARVFVDHLAVIVDPADHAEAERDEHHDPDETVGQIGPQQRRHGNAEQNQHAAHSRRTGFDEVRLRTVFTNGLADLHRGQLADHRRATDEPDQQRGDGGHHRTESQITEHAQEACVILQPLRQRQ